MGLVQALDYSIPVPNGLHRAMWHVSSSRPGAWLFARSMPQIDRLVLRASRGQLTAASLAAGIPVLTLTTTGARTGQRRTSPLLGVPFNNDIAIIGTHFGQTATPAWYYNLRAEPRAHVAFRTTSVPVTARDATAGERAAIWALARKIYTGYDSYARRITGRQIPIMILSE